MFGLIRELCELLLRIVLNGVAAAAVMLLLTFYLAILAVILLGPPMLVNITGDSYWLLLWVLSFGLIVTVTE